MTDLEPQRSLDRQALEAHRAAIDEFCGRFMAVQEEYLTAWKESKALDAQLASAGPPERQRIMAALEAVCQRIVDLSRAYRRNVEEAALIHKRTIELFERNGLRMQEKHVMDFARAYAGLFGQNLPQVLTMTSSPERN